MKSIVFQLTMPFVCVLIGVGCGPAATPPPVCQRYADSELNYQQSCNGQAPSETVIPLTPLLTTCSDACSDPADSTLINDLANCLDNCNACYCANGECALSDGEMLSATCLAAFGPVTDAGY